MLFVFVFVFVVDYLDYFEAVGMLFLGAIRRCESWEVFADPTI